MKHLYIILLILPLIGFGQNNEPKVVGVGGVFFKTENTEQTKKWYQENLGFPTDEWGTMFKSRDIDNPDLITYLQWSPFDKKLIILILLKKSL